MKRLQKQREALGDNDNASSCTVERKAAAANQPVSRRVLEILETDGGWLTVDGIIADHETRWGDPNRNSMRRSLSRLTRQGRILARPIPGLDAFDGLGVFEYKAAARVEPGDFRHVDK